MCRILASTLLFFALGAPAVAQDALPETDLSAIRGVIEGQLQAFLEDDGQRAYGFAAPGIQLIFPNAEVFMAMVKTGYAPVYRSAEVEFRDIDPLPEGRWLQQVLIVGMDGRVVLALYTMERQQDGTWKIAGCTLAKANEATT
ncbi:MAG: DUF4864 domain-containing protein [Alphaproteobacteria bacterium]